ncbi:MAG: hypothetical protein KA059_04990 [Elusimicrobiales bacterium]|nr:hypothetical protein [Elusimicrobiales bacterium]
MKFEAEYSLYLNNEKIEEDSSVILFGEESLSIFPKTKQALSIHWQEITTIFYENYKVYITLICGKVIEIKSLGYKFEDFIRLASKFRNERLIKIDMVDEPLKKSITEASISYYSMDKSFKDKAELHIYETSLVVFPDTHNFIRLPLKFIDKIKEGDYSIEITIENGERLEISELGKNFDHFKESLHTQINLLDIMVQNIISSFMPQADSFSIRTASKKINEGKLIKISEIEKSLPEFFTNLEKRICSNETDTKEFQYLFSISEKDKISFGIKKGLMGKMSGDCFIFLFFIKTNENLLAVFESFSIDTKSKNETDNRASYFYRCNTSFDDFLSFFNTAMTDINFRRMPILISDEKLGDPRYQIYNSAIYRIPNLKKLRELYIGRVIHSNFESWSNDINELIKFAGQNLMTGKRWTKNIEIENEEEICRDTNTHADTATN